MNGSLDQSGSGFLDNFSGQGSILAPSDPAMLRILDALPFYVILIDENHRILMANKATSDVLGLEAAELVGQYCPSAVHGIETGQYAGCPLEEAVGSGAAVEREHYDAASGRWLKICVYPTGMLTADHKQVFFHMMQDISAEKEATEKLRRSEERFAKNFRRAHGVNQVLQNELLPQAPVRDDIEIGLFYRSMGDYTKVGGDFYDFIELDDHRLVVAVGDVSGKGLEAANMISMLKYTLRAYLHEGKDLKSCMRMLNRLLCEELPADKFITLGIALFDTKQRSVEYVSAGHPLPVMSRSCKVDRISVTQGLPLGVFPDVHYLPAKVDDAHHCYFFMYSDGLIEAGGRKGEPFGRRLFFEFLEENEVDDVQQMADGLLNQAALYAGSELNDDVSVVVMKIL